MPKNITISTPQNPEDFTNLRRDLDYILGQGREVCAFSLSFSQTLFAAIIKADKKNLAKLDKQFPDHVHTYKSYRNPNYLFEKES